MCVRVCLYLFMYVYICQWRPEVSCLSVYSFLPCFPFFFFFGKTFLEHGGHYLGSSYLLFDLFLHHLYLPPENLRLNPRENIIPHFWTHHQVAWLLSFRLFCTDLYQEVFYVNCVVILIFKLGLLIFAVYKSALETNKAKPVPFNDHVFLH